MIKITWSLNPLALELDLYTIYVKCEYFMNQEG